MNYQTGLLISTSCVKLKEAVAQIQNKVKLTLYVEHCSPELVKSPLTVWNKRNASNDLLSPRNIALWTYQKTMAYENLDIKILLSNIRQKDKFSIIKTIKPIDIIFYDFAMTECEMKIFAEKYVSNKSAEYNVESLDINCVENDAGIKFKPNSDDNQADYVALGGTFDRLHSGHKVLLTEAILRCKKRLTVGITENSMIQNKTLWELIEPCATRISRVNEFVRDVQPDLEYNIVPINDIYGPTKDDPDLQMLVVSEESKAGGAKVNELRKSNGFSELQLVSISLVSDETNEKQSVEEAKVSSSNYRIRLLGMLVKEPVYDANLPKRPYIIGLTGCMASGKSSVANVLQKFGAMVIMADQYSHLVYLPDQPAHRQIVDTFGKDILMSDNTIDRKELAKIVFSNKELLVKLNAIVWPHTRDLIKKEIESSPDYTVVVIEAALILDAGWQKDCHEIWSCVIPPKEAVKRIMKRNNLDENEANLRLASQPSNADYVAQSNVILCTLWEEQFTVVQVEKAWKLLMTRISNFH